MTSPVIETLALCKSFAREDVLRGLDWKIEPGQVVGLVGTNGAGKTTLIKCLLGLLRATGGSSRVFGDDSWDLSAATKARLGYVSQEFEMLPWMTVQQMCDYTGAFYDAWQPARVAGLISEWQLPPDKRIGALSTGQRQKLGVILAMGHRPELLVLDEPVASLDPMARRQFLQSLIEFTESETNTVLFSTHITSDLERIASHVAILRGGRLAWFGPLDVLKDGCKRLRLYSERAFPVDFAIPGAIRYDVNGEQALVVVAQFDEETLRSISEKWHAEVQVEDLSLEEIFLEWNAHSPGGSDRIE